MTKQSVLTLAIPLALVLALVGGARSADLTGRDVVKRLDDLGSVKDMTAELEMRIIHKSGMERIRQINLATKKTGDGGEKMLMRFLVPADVKGTGFLSITRPGAEDQTWLYLPALKKPRRITSEERGGSFMGSDLAYEDVGSLKIDDYRHTLVRTEKLDGEEVYVVESVPVSEKIKRDCGFSKKTWWIRKDTFTLARAEFLDGSGKLLKVLRGWDVVSLTPDAWFATRMEMKNVETGSRTALTFKNIRVNTGVPDEHFTERYLVRAN